LLISFNRDSKFRIFSELLRVESPSDDVQGHGGQKIIDSKKKNFLIDQIELVGNNAIRIIFSDDCSSGIYIWDLLHDFGKNHGKYLKAYYNS